MRTAGTARLYARYSSPKRRSNSASSCQIIGQPANSAKTVRPYSTISPEPCQGQQHAEMGKVDGMPDVLTNAASHKPPFSTRCGAQADSGGAGMCGGLKLLSKSYS